MFDFHRKDGTCVVASGAWTPNGVSVDDDDAFGSAPYSTCFVYWEKGVPASYCWSHSYKTSDGDWKPCKPKGYGSLLHEDSVWTDRNINHDQEFNDCGPPCTDFKKNLMLMRIYNTIVMN